MTATATVDPVGIHSPPQVSSYFVNILRQRVALGPALLWSSTWGDPDTVRVDFISSWRTTHTGWNTQSVLSVESPLAPSGLLNAAAAVRNRSDRHDDKSQQSWFIPSDPLAKKAFNHIGRKLGPNRASAELYSQIAMPLKSAPPHDDDLLIVPCRNNDGGSQDDLIHLVMGTRGFVYVTSEELDHEDVNLQALDDAYRQVGRRRYRRIWLAYSRVRREVVGAAIAYRGPLELDFCQLSNRCDIVVHSMLSNETTASVARLLMTSAASVYGDFYSETIPILTDERTAALLTAHGGQWIRNVGLAIILDSAYEDWYRYLYERFARNLRQRRQGHPPSESRQVHSVNDGFATVAA